MEFALDSWLSESIASRQTAPRLGTDRSRSRAQVRERTRRARHLPGVGPESVHLQTFLPPLKQPPFGRLFLSKTAVPVAETAPICTRRDRDPVVLRSPEETRSAPRKKRESQARPAGLAMLVVPVNPWVPGRWSRGDQTGTEEERSHASIAQNDQRGGIA